MQRPGADGTVYGASLNDAAVIPTPQLAMILLREAEDAWHLGNWFNEREQWDGLPRSSEAAMAWTEAWSWLRQTGLVVFKPGESSAHGVQLSRLGQQLSRRPDDLVGTKLMRTALGDGGPLDPGDDLSAERDARAHLFAGAVGLFKNPSSHRPVDWDDPMAAAEVVLLADLLLRLLERLPAAAAAD